MLSFSIFILFSKKTFFLNSLKIFFIKYKKFFWCLKLNFKPDKSLRCRPRITVRKINRLRANKRNSGAPRVFYCAQMIEPGNGNGPMRSGPMPNGPMPIRSSQSIAANRICEFRTNRGRVKSRVRRAQAVFDIFGSDVRVRVRLTSPSTHRTL